MSELITIVKNQQVQSSKEQNKGGGQKYNNQDKIKSGGKGGRNLKGPDTNSSGPFRNGAPPMQCYNCGEWGHKSFDCPSPPLNYGRGEAPENRKGTNTPPGNTASAGQAQPDQSTKTKEN